MATRKSEPSMLRYAATAGVVYLTAGAVLAIGGFFTPHSLAREAALMSDAHATSGHTLRTMTATAHQVVMTGHHALAISLHLAMIPVHACLQLLSSVFGG